MSISKYLLVCSFLAAAAWAADRGQEVVLWPNGAPGSEGITAKELVQPHDDTHNYIRLSQIHNPSVLVYLPPKEKATGTAVIIAPGGGHAFLSMDLEGYEIADWFNNIGVAAFILKYRLAREPGSHYSVQGNALPDAQRAIRLVRSRANEWGLDPSRIGIMGFSAGGELAALAETRFDSGSPDAPDPIQHLSSRPDFALVIYPGFRPDTINDIPKDTPPTFLVCATDDRSHVVTTANLYLALQKANIPAEMHLYEHGGHGFGMRDRHSTVTHWNQQLLEWLTDHKLVHKDL